GLLAFSIIAVAHGVLLSFFRRLGWILGAVGLAWLAAAERAYPRLAILNPLGFFWITHVGTQPVIGLGGWPRQGALAAAALGLGGWLWLAEHDFAVALAQRLRRHSRAKKVGAAVLLVGATMIIAVAATDRSTEGGDDEGWGSADAPPLSLET